MTDSKDGKEQADVENGVNLSRQPSEAGEGEVEVPYSIYGTKEKWLIVAMVALAGFYR